MSQAGGLTTSRLGLGLAMIRILLFQGRPCADFGSRKPKLSINARNLGAVYAARLDNIEILEQYTRQGKEAAKSQNSIRGRGYNLIR